MLATSSNKVMDHSSLNQVSNQLFFKQNFLEQPFGAAGATGLSLGSNNLINRSTLNNTL